MCTEKTHGSLFQPIFISVDPARDTLPQIARYLADFHPTFVGATAPLSAPQISGAVTLPSEGSQYDTIKAICKVYRVYFSTPPDADPNGDYLVDHSIFIYLMDPQGQFVEAFGQAKGVDEVVERVNKEIELWQKTHAVKV